MIPSLFTIGEMYFLNLDVGLRDMTCFGQCNVKDMTRTETLDILEQINFSLSLLSLPNLYYVVYLSNHPLAFSPFRYFSC